MIILLISRIKFNIARITTIKIVSLFSTSEIVGEERKRMEIECPSLENFKSNWKNEWGSTVTKGRKRSTVVKSVTGDV